jgi:hypothetical protein
VSTVRLTVGQAIVRFLAAQRSERDGETRKLFGGCLGILGHGNVAGLGEALLEAELLNPGALPYHQARNEQAMVHTAVAYARMLDRLTMFACTSSVGPGGLRDCRGGGHTGQDLGVECVERRMACQKGPGRLCVHCLHCSRPIDCCLSHL